MKKSLAGLTILVTRPAHQADKLIEAITACKGQTILFPTIEIVPAEKNEALKKIFNQLSNFHWIIFISRNAVIHSIPLIHSYHSELTTSTKIAAVGKSTAQALNDHKISVDCFPPKQFNSEALLALPAMQTVNGKSILIVSGEDGRSLIRNTLQERGAKVEEAIVYRRIIPSHFSLFDLQKKSIDIIVCTSNTGLENLCTMLGDQYLLELQNKKLVVISERMQDFSKQLGFQSVTVSENATDEAILAALKK